MMKQLMTAILAISVIAFVACNNSANQTSGKKDSMSSDHRTMDTGKINSGETVDAPVIKASFTDVSTDVAAHIAEVVSHYFHIKHALTKDDAAEAKNGATMMLQVIS